MVRITYRLQDVEGVKGSTQEGDGNRSQEDVVRNRLGMAVVIALLLLFASLTLVASASGASPTAKGPGAGTAQVTQPALSPIQQLAFDVDKKGPSRSDQEASTASVGPEGEMDGHVAAGYCHLQS
jgi:hypothetical protein